MNRLLFLVVIVISCHCYADSSVRDLLDEEITHHGTYDACNEDMAEIYYDLLVRYEEKDPSVKLLGQLSLRDEEYFCDDPFLTEDECIQFICVKL